MAKEYWWVSVGGNDCEPAVVQTKIGNFEGGPQIIEKSCFTFGCPDPFDLQAPGCPVVLVRQMPDAPLTPEKAQARRKWDEKAWSGAASHGYRRFD